MILGAPQRSVLGPTMPARAVTPFQVDQARMMLESLGAKTKGAPLTLWQKFKIRRMAPGVAARVANDLRPPLSNTQAMQLRQIVTG